MKYRNENFSGSYDFRCGVHDEGWQVGSQLHEYSEILYCREGEGTVTLNSVTVKLTKNRLVWIPPNTVHQFNFPKAKLICAVFSNDFIPLFFSALGGKSLKAAAVDPGELSPLVEALPSLSKSDALKLCGILNLLCDRAIKACGMEEERQTDGILYQKVVTYLSDHFREDVTLGSLAALFGYNEKYLSHSLHELTGLHFKKLLAFYRIQHAKKLLEKGDCSVSQAALDCGFSALNTFNRAFKEITSLTPSQYRKRFGKKKR